MNDNPLVSIIITNYNNAEDVLECLDSIRETTYPNYEIIVVDDGSTDNSLEVLRKREDIRLIETGKNYGFIKANNIGIRESKGEMICLLNNDTVVDKEWLGEMVKTISSDEEIAATYPFFIDYGTSKEEMWPTPSVLKRLKGDTYGLTGYTIEHVIDDYITTYISASGCCLLFKKDLFDKYSDEDYFMYMEDVYFCWRLKLRGYDIKRSPYAVVYHKGGGTVNINKMKPKVRYLCERNRIMNLFIFYKAKTLFKILPLLLADEIKKVLLMIVRLFYDPRYIFIVLSARLWLFLNIINIYKKRRAIQRERKVPDANIIEGLSYKVTNGSSLAENLANRMSFLYIKFVNLKTYELAKQTEEKG